MTSSKTFARTLCRWGRGPSGLMRRVLGLNVSCSGQAPEPPAATSQIDRSSSLGDESCFGYLSEMTGLHDKQLMIMRKPRGRWNARSKVRVLDPGRGPKRASGLSGGKFSNGAVTAPFGSAFRIAASRSSDVDQGGTTEATPDGTGTGSLRALFNAMAGLHDVRMALGGGRTAIYRDECS